MNHLRLLFTHCYQQLIQDNFSYNCLLLCTQTFTHFLIRKILVYELSIFVPLLKTHTCLMCSTCTRGGECVRICLVVARQPLFSFHKHFPFLVAGESVLRQEQLPSSQLLLLQYIHPPVFRGKILLNLLNINKRNNANTRTNTCQSFLIFNFEIACKSRTSELLLEQQNTATFLQRGNEMELE